jgi:hypothetical protein
MQGKRESCEEKNAIQEPKAQVIFLLTCPLAKKAVAFPLHNGRSVPGMCRSPGWAVDAFNGPAPA